MDLKFRHYWHEKNGADRAWCVTALDLRVSRQVSAHELAAANNAVMLKAVVQEQNELTLTYAIYDMPRKEFYEALLELMRWCHPVDSEKFYAARLRLEALAKHLDKTK